jgi:hypothetical protein
VQHAYIIWSHCLGLNVVYGYLDSIEIANSGLPRQLLGLIKGIDKKTESGNLRPVSQTSSITLRYCYTAKSSPSPGTLALILSNCAKQLW